MFGRSSQTSGLKRLTHISPTGVQSHIVNTGGSPFSQLGLKVGRRDTGDRDRDVETCHVISYVSECLYLGVLSRLLYWRICVVFVFVTCVL